MTIPVELEIGDLLAPPSDAGRLEHLRAEGLGDGSGLTWVLDRAEELVHHDPAAAEELCLLCDQAARDLTGLEGGAVRGEQASLVHVRARASYLRARILTERGDLESGLTLVEQARRLWSEAGRTTDALRTDLGRMSVLDDLGRHHEAIAVGTALLEATAGIDSGSADHALSQQIRATALENLGAAYGLLGEHERALRAYAEAETAYRGLGLEADTARPLGNRGIELLALGRPREALSDLRQAIVLLEAAGDRLYAASCQGFLAQAHQQLGELAEALAVLEEARVTLDALGAQAEADRLLLSVAETYLAVGLLSEARHAAGLAAERTTRAGMSHDAGVAHFVQGQAALNEGDIVSAQDSLGRAAALFEQVGDRQFRARTRLAQAEATMSSGHRREAARLLSEAADDLRAGGWLVPLAAARLRQADLADDPAQAARWLDAAGQLSAEVGLPALHQQYTLRRARQLRAEGHVEEAERLLTELIVDLGHVSHSLSDHAMRIAYRADKTAAPDELIGLLLERDGVGDVARARAVSDAAKAQTLRDLITDSVGSGPDVTGTGSELARAHADLSAAYATLQEATARDQLSTSRRHVELLEQRVALLRLQDAAQRAAVTPTGSATSTTGDGAGVPTLEFHVLGDDVAVFVTVAGVLTVRTLRAVVRELADGLSRLGDQWSRFQLGSVFRGRHADLLVETANRLLGRLYDVLLAPVADLLPDDGHLHLVPHGIIGQLPLQALWDGRQPLLARFVLTVSPTRVGESHPVVGRTLLERPLVVGAPDAAAPSVEVEALEVGRLLPSARVLVGEQATTAAVASALPGSTVVHIACHGLYRAGNPLFSRLRLADRWVTSAEILRLDLTGALVVLSACESGQHGRAAEPVGLGWAFLAAGASGVVASQWVVHDATTRALMVAFYRHLAAGLDPAAALRLAQLAAAVEHPHPFFWAPFTYLASPGQEPRRQS